MRKTGVQLRPLEGTDPVIERGFVKVGSRRVHYRRAGAGPILVAVHESPRSSRTLLPLIRGLADRFDVFAPDTPGFGLSDPLKVDPLRLDDLAHALHETLDASGIGRHVLYGSHTGAAIAIRFARHYPERVSALILDGVAAFTPEEREDFLQNYLLPWAPAWDGSHVAALWSRAKDMRMWFPWQHREPWARLPLDPPDAQLTHETALGYLLAGPDFHRGYSCATELDAVRELRELRIPVTIFTRPEDVLRPHCERLPTNDYVRVVLLDKGPKAWLQAVVEAANRGGADRTVHTVSHSQQRLWLRQGDGFIHARAYGAGDDAILIIDDVPSCGADFDTWIPSLFGGRRVLVLDLPGCAGSDPLAGPLDLETLADSVTQSCRQLGATRFIAVGLGASAALLPTLKHRDERCAGIAAISPPTWLSQKRAGPPVELPTAASPEHSGRDFLASWFTLRDLWLYEDVDANVLAHRTPVAPPSVEALQRRFIRFWLGPAAGGMLQALRDASARAHIVIESGSVYPGLEAFSHSLR